MPAPRDPVLACDVIRILARIVTRAADFGNLEAVETLLAAGTGPTLSTAKILNLQLDNSLFHARLGDEVSRRKRR